MPHWLFPAVIVLALVAFIIFAFRQGLKVKPNPDARDNWNLPQSTVDHTGDGPAS